MAATMATQHIVEVWRRSTCIVLWLIWIAALHFASCNNSLRGNLVPVDQHSFLFTSDSYNATIMENSVGKTYVTPSQKMGMYLTDPTLDIRYRIISGDDDKMFKPEENLVGDFCFLLLRTRSGDHKVINRERHDSYPLVVKAIAKYRNGPTLTAQTQVYVTVLDANDANPLFYPITYSIAVAEDQEINKPIVTVSATDADVGVNGEIYYSFKRRTDFFAIHPTSGVVSLTRPLRFIEQNFYELLVLAEDRGPRIGYGPQESWAPIQVKVLEVNFHAPRIDFQELPSVVEHGRVGTIYALLYVSDRDFGDNGQIGSVEIIEGDPNGFFELRRGNRETEYNIQVAKELDREESPGGFNLTISAKDKGSPPKETIRMVYVKLADTNDHAPHFSKEYYEVEIDEIVPVDTPLIFVAATDADVGKNAEVTYLITEGNDHGWFKIDSLTGLVSVASHLDSELENEASLVLGAQDRGNLGTRKMTYAHLKVTIHDCNDNSPVFNETKLTVTLSESQPVGTEVCTVAAYDRDSGENGYISFSIANMDHLPFTIDHFTGKISTTAILDYEAMKRMYHVRVRASDWGSPFRRESETVLRIRLRDTNDNKPQFEKVDCVGYLSRQAPRGTQVVVVSAIDFDIGNIISYHILSGNEDNCFEMTSSTGDLRLKCNLEEYPSTFRSLTITATDGTNYADPTTVNITLVNNDRNRQLSHNDANINCRDTGITEALGTLLQKAEENNQAVEREDMATDGPNRFIQNLHAPKFLPDTQSTVTIQESHPVGQKIMQFKAEDPDPGYSGRLMFVISDGNHLGTFKIDTYSGELMVLSSVDRELVDRHVLNITVMDMGYPTLSSITLLEIIVEDVNDNPPQFEKSSYSISISENVLPNTTIIQVVATDRDLGSNAEISYEIVSDTDDFMIDPESGIIMVTEELDRETNPEYELYVQAKDHSVEHPLSAIVSVTIKLLDVNDNPPTFVPESYHIQIREDLPVGSVVMIITAHDPDLSGGGNVRYSLISNAMEKFVIDRLTGTIRIASHLDFEQQQIYNLTAKARDRGEPALSSKCQVVIEIIDVNENLYGPMFDNFVFQGKVKENQPRNTTVMQLVAIDKDIHNPKASPKDYDIVYSIRDGSGMGRFTIDHKGVIRTNEVLDRESQAHYWLTVYAVDRGTLPYSAWVEVLIEVEDLNDNVPQSEEPEYNPSVLENSAEGTSVVKIQAYDGDATVNNQISYDITSGNPQGFFSIDSTTGLITTTRRLLDREKQDEHILEVTVSDNGIPPLSSTSRVVVTVSDLNDNPPQFTERLYRVRVPAMDSDTNDVPLYRVLAFDNDKGPNADIDYSIKAGKGNGRFRINPKTGMITSQKDFTAGSQYDLTIKAVDNGRPQQKETARVLLEVMERPTTSANAPRFVSGPVTTKVMENEVIGHMVLLMSAEDSDGDKIWYSITGGNEGDTFSIDTENGNIVLARKLDWETKTDYNLTIAASDGVHETQTWVHVMVMDINDNRPVFSKDVYIENIVENVPVGTEVLTITASDADEDQRLFYTIHSVTDQASFGKFIINSESGVITTMDELNREAIARHELTVMVRDQGTPSKRSLARVIINIEDHNDHVPEFLSPRFEGRVFETSPIGTSVVQIIATDKDRGNNAEIKYSIISGNVGNAFNVDHTLGIISVGKLLDRRVQPEYLLTVKAADGGTPSLTSTVNVHIEVTVANNAAPKFDQVEYTTEVAENKPAGSHVLAVSASSRSSITYTIEDGNYEEMFDINPNSGVVTATVIFDYETHSFFNLTVRATNMVGAWAEATVLVHVLDKNDNRPIFTKDRYTGNISEASQVGSVVLDKTNSPLVVKASDADTNLNALLIYSIVEPTAQSVFSIDSSTGAVRTLTPLDHEVAPLYEFTVQVMDMGSPQLSAEVAAEVAIYVTDVNDSPPQFTRDEYTATVLLPTYSDVSVIQVEAQDLDSEVNSQLEYSIVSGNDDNLFLIQEHSGIITVSKTESLSGSYHLTVRASDGTFEGEAIVKISIETTKDTGLQFSESIYYSEIVENQTGIAQVTVVQAVGQALNEHLIFSILNPSDMFQIGSTSGVVQTKDVIFDREEQENYTLVIEVRDQRTPPRVAHCLLNVHVLDINDNYPVFVNQPYFAIVHIDSAQGDVVTQVTAIDRDTGCNSNIVYEMVEGGDGKLAINEKSGAITVSSKLTQEDQNQEHMLVIEARDHGEEPKAARVTVPVRIMNRATPIFENPYYRVSIPENVALYTAITNMQATSPTGQKLIYSITSGDIYDEFAIEFNTDMDVLGPCSITVIDDLDYEMRNQYKLTIRAADVKTGAYADAMVQINLQDVNDETPSFKSLKYVETMSEAVPIGTSVLTVSATDKDSGKNAMIFYHLEDTDPGSSDSSYFHIDQNRGIILTKQKLDHEKHQSLTFLVTASDQGMPALMTSVEVTVVVLDLNDNAPKFDQPVYGVTITDQMKRGQFVTRVTASDLDSSDQHHLAYSIVGGSEKEAFMIDDRKGIITLSTLRKPNLQPSYVLNISVTDGVFTNYARVRINVRNSNNHVPMFTQAVYDVDVTENLPSGEKVAVVTAVDDDPGQFGHMNYGIDSEDASEYFRIDSQSGELFSKVSLDREEQTLYKVPVVVRDGGGRTGYAHVHVNVGDQGDNKPKFKMVDYKANIYASAVQGDLVIQVSAEDKDLGSNADLEYYIVESSSPPASDHFTVDPKTGKISVKDDLNDLDNQMFQFFVRARDRGSPPSERGVPVEIYVMSNADVPPEFKQEKLTYFVPEDSEIGSVIATVTAESNDTLKYSIVPGNLKYTNKPEKFAISDEGKVGVIESLDRETTEVFELTLKAETETSPPLIAYCHVTIQIMDVNDNWPTFESNPYEVSVAENAIIGSKVIQVIAHDSDTGANGDISYSFGPAHSKLSNIFALDSQNGWITTLVKLDREAQPEYTFDIVVSDRGQQAKSNTTTVIIDLLDHNDEPPVFSQEVYKGAVNEDALPGTIVLTVTSTDKDLGNNALVEYYITDGDPLGQFNIRSTGEVFVNKPLDREATAWYELVVTATDGAFTSITRVVITILDANDNSPICEQPMYQSIVTEVVPIGTFVIQVSASDRDEPNTRNSHIEYTISGLGSEMFSIHRRTGIIQTRRELDREKISSYMLDVTATDGGDRSCKMEVNVVLTDENDNPPLFSMPVYTVAIPEDAEINTLITRVSAVDSDVGINRKVRYAVKEIDAHFKIDASSGIISLAQTLDREKQAKYNLTMYAYDQGTPKMTSVAHLIVRLLDINDNPPEFEHNTYSATVREDIRVGTSIMRVFATSRDTGVNAEITYALTAGNELGAFRVDSRTGAISVIDTLDYETAREYFLTVEATDGGTPPLSNTAVVKVNITDANDNAPSFGRASYHAEVQEDALPEDNVIQVEAMDLDSEANAAVTYVIISGDPHHQFTINEGDGYITVNGVLDRESVSNYVLEVQALDSGHPRLTGTTLVNIAIGDANDNPPLFTETNYSAVVQEDKSIGFQVITFDVIDADTDPNGPPFSFDIVDGNQNNEFRIDKDGTLTTAARFERDIKDTYELAIRVFDNGRSPLYSDTSITVKIIEESAFEPIVTPLSVSVAAYNDEFSGGVIGRVKAIDRDAYDRLAYAIVSQNQYLFDIHALDGTIKAVEPLDAGDYNLNISITDGKYFVYTQVHLTVASISDDMVENAVVVRFHNMIPEEFIAVHHNNFLISVKQSLSVRSKDIHILSVQPASDDTTAATRTKRATSSDLDVLVSVQKTQDTFYRGNTLRRRITQVLPEIESQMGVKLAKVFNDVCTKNACEEGDCKTEILFDTNQMLTIMTDKESYVSAKHSLSQRCLCKPGFGGSKCQEAVDACDPNPCLDFQVCSEDGNLGYHCDCPAGKTGPSCDNIDHDQCKGQDCEGNKALTFTGNSYARWRLNDPMERRLTLSLEIKTVQDSARLMHAVGRVDYSIFEMVDGMLQYRFDCGSGEGFVRLDSTRVNDGQWHYVLVERRGSIAKIKVDDKYFAESSAAGTNNVLNLDSNDIYFGAEVDNAAHAYPQIRHGYQGCIRNLKMSGVLLPYSGSSSIGTLQKFERVEFHCKRAYVPGVCSSSPCFNGGTCLPKGPDAYLCHCLSRFIGARCEVDTNPCASNPCRHGGMCENLPNDFRCRCPSKLEGKRCERGYYCKPNPCKHGGTCIDGEDRPICDCHGFDGDFCERDIDECRKNPCKNGATCTNTHGGFNCHCSAGTSGDLCEDVTFSSVSSTPFNITIEEICGIAGVVAALLLLVIIFVIIVRWRRRKRRERAQHGDNHSNDFIYNCDDLKRSNKMNNVEASANLLQNHNMPNIPPSPRPPPVPNRPASYTPSTADSLNTLNNFDTICNYGSAGDELENIGNLPHIEIPEFLTNLDVEKLPTVGRGKLPPTPDGLRKQSWNSDNPNIAYNYPNGEYKKQTKNIPMESPNREMVKPNQGAPQGSITSLPISEYDDDMPANAGRGKKKGYHWDTSDWATTNPLPNITEVPMREIPDSPGSSRSNESNAHVDPADYDPVTDYPESEYVENDSEYVGDSEYCDNEFGEEDDDDEDDDGDPANFPDPPSYEQILALQGDYDDSSLPPEGNNYNLHPNQYLPRYGSDMLRSQSDIYDGQEPNGNANDDEEEVIQYGFPRPRQPHFAPQDFTSDPNYDTLRSVASVLDDMSVSMGGYTSTNASCSDISGLCEIEDSEVNLSDDDSADETKPLKSSSKSRTHTQV